MKLSAERRRQRGDLIRLSAFLCLAATVALWIAAVTGEYRPEDRDTYAAVFDDVSGLSTGDEVRIAGVDVGKVRGIDVQRDNTVRVTFDVSRDHQLTTTTLATVQYRNLTGDRVVQLSQPSDGGDPLAVGDTIPVSHTASALDLDTLLNGFRPLFAGLSPTQVNELSGQVVQVLQGQQSAVASLVDHLASATSTIGGRERLIGEVIRNLNSVLGAVDEKAGAVGELIDSLEALTVGLDQQDTQVLDAAARIDDFADEAATLLAAARQDLRTDLLALTGVARGVNSRAGTLVEVLSALPLHYRALQATSSYGPFFNTFLCGVRLETDLGFTPWIQSEAARCRG